MAATGTLWQGTTDLTPGKVQLSFEATRWVLKTDFSGPYQACLAQKPLIGATIEGQAAVYVLSKVDVVELDGDAGRIDVTAEILADPSSFSTAALGSAIYEDEWAELQKPIETHPRCGVLSHLRSYYLADGTVQTDSSTGGKGRTWEDWADLLGANTGTAKLDYDASGTGAADGSDGTNSAGDNFWTLAERVRVAARPGPLHEDQGCLLPDNGMAGLRVQRAQLTDLRKPGLKL